MLPDRNILKTAKTILKIQDKLHPLLFGEDGFMLEETRQEPRIFSDRILQNQQTFRSLTKIISRNMPILRPGAFLPALSAASS